jgi:nucleoside-diphosphate-sugar epimerase
VRALFDGIINQKLRDVGDMVEPSTSAILTVIDPTRLEILGDGTQSKPYVHVEDCLDGMMFGHRTAKELVNCYNLAVSDWTSVNQIAEWTIEAMGLDPKSVAITPRRKCSSCRWRRSFTRAMPRWSSS